MAILVVCAVVALVLLVVVFAVQSGPGSYGSSGGTRGPLPPGRLPQLPTEAEADALRAGLVAERVRMAEEEARLLDIESDAERRRRLSQERKRARGKA
jgi:hypothetical protein